MSRLLVTQYHNEVERIIQYGGSRNESSIRVSFQNLLNEYCKTRDFMLIPELEYKTKKGKLVYPDGTIKDALRLDWGYWESKDQNDNLDAEIEKKLAKGYPDDNILFEDSQTAVLIQGGNESMRVSMRDADALDEIINALINYTRPEVKDFREAIATFKEDLPKIIEALRGIIQQQSETNPAFQQARDKFLVICQESINPEVSVEDVREMIIQHILTEDIFINIFNESQFHRENNIAAELQGVIETFFTGSTRRNTLSTIERYYAVIRRTAASIYNHYEKQKFLKAVYENFYKAYNPKAADRLGIVYTPNEIVRFMIESTDYLVHKHFGKLLADSGVEILDPATGTGTFVTELIEYLPKDKLTHKYKNEIHCNEVAILPYYIANLNIEFTYQQKMGQYEQFNSACFVDTLDHTSFAGKQMNLFAMTVENTQRIKEQNERNISVIIGNPPYNAKQENFNQRNPNRPYAGIDSRIKETYIHYGTAQNQITVYDMYTRFFRWASD
ncbi:MAG: N-6 DNA methylase, partial [Chroococcales cyanobacterium]